MHLARRGNSQGRALRGSAGGAGFGATAVRRPGR